MTSIEENRVILWENPEYATSTLGLKNALMGKKKSRQIRNGSLSSVRTRENHWSSRGAFFENGIGRLVTVAELAKYLACSEKTIRDWVLKEAIPTVRPQPRMVRFDMQEIQRWLSERKSIL